MTDVEKMTAEDALEAHMERFGFIPWGFRQWMTITLSPLSRRRSKTENRTRTKCLRIASCKYETT